MLTLLGCSKPSFLMPAFKDLAASMFPNAYTAAFEALVDL